MGKPFILVGDSTSHGGKVIQGSSQSTVEGIPIARVGDQVTCPINGHGGVTKIVSGDDTCIIDGKPAARDGDMTACGAKLIASQQNVTCGGGGSHPTNTKEQAAATPASKPTPEELEHKFNDFFVLLNADGAIAANAHYAIEFPDGSFEYGMTDSRGHTNLHVTGDGAQELTIYLEGVPDGR